MMPFMLRHFHVPSPDLLFSFRRFILRFSMRAYRFRRRFRRRTHDIATPPFSFDYFFAALRRLFRFSDYALAFRVFDGCHFMPYADAY